MALADGLRLRLKSVFTCRYVWPIDVSPPPDAHLSAYMSDGTNQSMQFRLESATTVDGKWHIKCLGTEKYLQVKPVGNDNIPWITADADNKNEDELSLACTLFSIVYFGPGPTTTIRLLHDNLQRYACVNQDSKTYPYCLCVSSPNTDKDSRDVFVYEECK